MIPAKLDQDVPHLLVIFQVGHGHVHNVHDSTAVLSDLHGSLELDEINALELRKHVLRLRIRAEHLEERLSSGLKIKLSSQFHDFLSLKAYLVDFLRNEVP